MEVSKKLIKGVIKRKYSSQKKLYELTLPYFNVICTRYLVDANNKKDVLQETMIRIFSKIEQFDTEKGDFKHWSRRILINECFRDNARGKRHLEVEYDSKDNTYELMSVSPEVISNLNVAELITFLKNMPRDYYEVFNLNIVDGYSHAEISEILGIKSSLSRKRLERAREWLNKNKINFSNYWGESNSQIAK